MLMMNIEMRNLYNELSSKLVENQKKYERYKLAQLNKVTNAPLWLLFIIGTCIG